MTSFIINRILSSPRLVGYGSQRLLLTTGPLIRKLKICGYEGSRASFYHEFPRCTRKPDDRKYWRISSYQRHQTFVRGNLEDFLGTEEPKVPPTTNLVLLDTNPNSWARGVAWLSLWLWDRPFFAWQGKHW